MNAEASSWFSQTRTHFIDRLVLRTAEDDWSSVNVSGVRCSHRSHGIDKSRRINRFWSVSKHIINVSPSICQPRTACMHCTQSIREHAPHHTLTYHYLSNIIMDHGELEYIAIFIEIISIRSLRCVFFYIAIYRLPLIDDAGGVTASASKKLFRTFCVSFALNNAKLCQQFQ